MVLLVILVTTTHEYYKSRGTILRLLRSSVYVREGLIKINSFFQCVTRVSYGVCLSPTYLLTSYTFYVLFYLIFTI